MAFSFGLSRAYFRVIIAVFLLFGLNVSLRSFDKINTQIDHARDSIFGDSLKSHDSESANAAAAAADSSHHVTKSNSAQPAVTSAVGDAHSLLKEGKNIEAWNLFSSEYQRENATFVSLVRNNELDAIVGSIRGVEDRFNRFYHYDWVFLNDEPFSEEFKKQVRLLVSGEAKFGLVPSEHWGYPEWIDQDYAAWCRKDFIKANVIYGGSESYRHMCRFESGFFYRHPLMNDYRYYWRVEPDTKYHCDVNYDVFKFMRQNNYKYSFTIALLEFPITVQTLWNHTVRFLSEHPEFKNPNSLSDFILDENGNYNFCHFWSNFEIADMDFWRGEAYSKYFDYLDQSGGFFYERWGDAPVHSLAASLFLDKDEIHFFEDIGYTHTPYTHCPDNCLERGMRCSCRENFDWDGFSCMPEYYNSQKMELPEKADYQKSVDDKKAWRDSVSGLGYKESADDRTRYWEETRQFDKYYEDEDKKKSGSKKDKGTTSSDKTEGNGSKGHKQANLENKESSVEQPIAEVNEA